MAFRKFSERRFNCLRIGIKAEYMVGEEKIELNRLEFSRQILQKEFGFKPEELNCLISVGKGNEWDVSFCRRESMERCQGLFEQSFQSEVMKKFQLTVLTDTSKRVVIVRMGSEMVEGKDVCTWLARYCNSVEEAVKVTDSDNVWTGAWRVRVSLKRDRSGYEGYGIIPSEISLGNNRGYVHYFGQPKLCRKCGAMGHLAAGCTKIICNVCKKEGHVASECEMQRTCNLCGSGEHFFSNCPHSFANRTRGREESERAEREEREREDREGRRERGKEGKAGGGEEEGKGKGKGEGVGQEESSEHGGEEEGMESCEQGEGESKHEGVGGMGSKLVGDLAVSESEGVSEESDTGSVVEVQINRGEGGVQDTGGSGKKGTGEGEEVSEEGEEGDSESGMDQEKGPSKRKSDGDGGVRAEGVGERRKKKKRGVRRAEVAGSSPSSVGSLREEYGGEGRAGEGGSDPFLDDIGVNVFAGEVGEESLNSEW